MDNSNPAMMGKLLIVPYGIETRYCVRIAYFVVVLLIVPYGIETEELGNLNNKSKCF